MEEEEWGRKGGGMRRERRKKEFLCRLHMDIPLSIKWKQHLIIFFI